MIEVAVVAVLEVAKDFGDEGGGKKADDVVETGLLTTAAYDALIA